MKTIIIMLSVITVIGAIIFGITTYLQPNNLAGCPPQPNGKNTCQRVDAIIALSGGDTQARTDAAIKLFKNGWADRLIFSGAAQDKSGPSNASVMQRQAIAAGVPPYQIELDEQSTDTAQNAFNTDAIFKRDGIQSAILVTSGYHQRRAYLEFERLAKDVTILNAPTNDKDWTMWWWLRPRGWWLAGGELAKIVVFYVSGLQL